MKARFSKYLPIAAVLLMLVAGIIFAGCDSGSWTIDPSPVPTDQPAIRITKVTWREVLGEIKSIEARGMVYNVDPKKHKIATYIRVFGGWWPKPTFDDPWTWIGSDSEWKTENLVTGGYDADADAVKVYLVKKGSLWKPGQNQAPPGDIIAEDKVEKPDESGTDSRGVYHEIIKE